MRCWMRSRLPNWKDIRIDMDATTLLREKVDPEALMSHFGFNHMRQDGEYIRSCCAIHGGDNQDAFVMNTEDGLWFCHTKCGGGDIFTLVQKIEGLNFPQAIEWLAKFAGVDIDNLEIVEQKQEYVKEIQKFSKTMKARKKNVPVAYHIPTQTKDVTKFRGFSAETLEHFGLKYVEEITLQNKQGKEYTVRDRLVFPIVQNGIQVGASFRRIRSKDTPKWSHQPVGIETKDILYNYDSAIGEREIVIVEGMPDVWAYHEIGITAVATFGAHITDQQYKLLMRTGADIVLSFDGDEAGRNATDKARALFRNKAIVKIVSFAQGEDPDNIPRQELLVRHESAKRVE